MIASAGTNTLHMAESLTNVNGRAMGRAGVHHMQKRHSAVHAVLLWFGCCCCNIASKDSKDSKDNKDSKDKNSKDKRIAVAIAMVDCEDGKDGKDCEDGMDGKDGNLPPPRHTLINEFHAKIVDGMDHNDSKSS